MTKKEALVKELKIAAAANLAAARAYRQMEYVPGLTYEMGVDRKFADAMWLGCMTNVHSSLSMLRVILKSGTAAERTAYTR